MLIFTELLHENRIAFEQRVRGISTMLGINPNHLMFVMWFETAHTLDHRIQNKKSLATGLIQFMPKTARSLGTSVARLRTMSNVDQLNYVYKYLLQFKCKDWLDLYCAIFWPKAIGKPDSFRITSDIVAQQNPIFDINKDLDIEKGEIRRVLLAQLPEKYNGILD